MGATDSFSVLSWFCLALIPIAIICQLLGYGDIGQSLAFRLVAFGVPTVCAVMAAMTFGMRCYRRDLLPRSILAAALAVSTVACLVFWALPFIVTPPLSRPAGIDALVYALDSAGIAILPALTVFSQAVWVDRLRYHR